jgi:hypothetical protein
VLYDTDFVSGQRPGNEGSPAVYATFAEAQQSLASGLPAGHLPPSLIRDVNIETNIITALICHADHGQPAKVCTRPVIKRLLRHVR